MLSFVFFIVVHWHEMDGNIHERMQAFLREVEELTTLQEQDAFILMFAIYCAFFYSLFQYLNMILKNCREFRRQQAPIAHVRMQRRLVFRIQVFAMTLC